MAEEKIIPLALPAPGSGKGRLRPIGGSEHDEFNGQLINRLAETLRTGNATAEARDEIVKGALAAMMDMKPASALEAMLCAQIVAINAATTECLRRAMLPDQPHEPRMANLAAASRLARAFAQLVDTLDRHRGKGTPQRIVVERVTVAAGGKAVVGLMTGGGDDNENRGRPHEAADARALGFAPGATMPSLHTSGDAMPAGSLEGTDAMPASRRRTG